MLRKLANMRAAKARLRQERIAAGLLDREPKLVRWFPLELGVRDKASGEVAWTDLRSIRDAARRLGVVLKFYQPGLPAPPPVPSVQKPRWGYTAPDGALL